MMRRSMVRLCSSSAPRPGHKDAGVVDWVRTFIDPTYHAERMGYIEEDVDATKSRKWVTTALLLYVVLFYIPTIVA